MSLFLIFDYVQGACCGNTCSEIMMKYIREGKDQYHKNKYKGLVRHNSLENRPTAVSGPMVRKPKRYKSVLEMLFRNKSFHNSISSWLEQCG